MKNKIKKLLGVVAILSLSLNIAGCSNESKSSSIELGEYSIDIKGSELFEAWEGDNSIKIIADFTNNSETEQSFAFSGIIADAYQDGIALDRHQTGIVGLESMSELVQPGETKEIAIGFSLIDYVKPIDIEIQDFLGGSEEVLSETIDISKLYQ